MAMKALILLFGCVLGAQGTRADYDRAAKLVKGDNEVRYQAPTIEAKGLGFDADEKRQVVHIRKDVRVTIQSANPLFQKKEMGGKTEKSAN